MRCVPIRRMSASLYVDITELAGADTLAFVTLGGERCAGCIHRQERTARSSDRTGRRQRSVALFDRATGRAIAFSSR